MNRDTQPSSTATVDARWAGAGSGEHYVGDRWRGTRARERDPRLVGRLLGRLPDATGIKSILDVPCGTGRLAGALDAGLFVQSDISLSMLQNIPAGSTSGYRVQASAAALPWATNSFDLVACCRLLHHLRSAEDRQPVLNELVRVSKRYLIASYWEAGSYGAWRRRTQGPLRRRKRPDVREAVPFAVLEEQLRAAGARVISRAHSFRFVSQQTFLLAEKVSPVTQPAP